MGWKSAWNSFKQGEFTDALSYAFIDESDIDASNKADSQLADLVAQSVADGHITEEMANETYKRIQQNAMPELIENPEMSPGIAFESSVIETVQKEMTMVEKGVKGVANWTLGAIPWQIYAIAGVVVIVVVLSFLEPQRR